MKQNPEDILKQRANLYGRWAFLFFGLALAVTILCATFVCCAQGSSSVNVTSANAISNRVTKINLPALISIKYSKAYKGDSIWIYSGSTRISTSFLDPDSTATYKILDALLVSGSSTSNMVSHVTPQPFNDTITVFVKPDHLADSPTSERKMPDKYFANGIISILSIFLILLFVKIGRYYLIKAHYYRGRMLAMQLCSSDNYKGMSFANAIVLIAGDGIDFKVPKDSSGEVIKLIEATETKKADNEKCCCICICCKCHCKEHNRMKSGRYF